MFSRVREATKSFFRTPGLPRAPVDGQPLGSSFRDPSGFVYTRAGVLYRQVNRVFQDEFEAVTALGAVRRAGAASGCWCPTASVSLELAATAEAAAVLQPEPVHFISYPYEWSFGQLRDAALLTLDSRSAPWPGPHPARRQRLQRPVPGAAARCSSTRSPSSRRKEGAPWQAYRQFCEHFLVPLALMSRVDIGPGASCSAPTSTASRSSSAAGCSAAATWRSLGLLFHVRLHAWPRSGATATRPPGVVRPALRDRADRAGSGAEPARR